MLVQILNGLVYGGLILPNYFGHIGEQGGKLRPIITETIAANVATTPPTGTCNMGSL